MTGPDTTSFNERPSTSHTLDPTYSSFNSQSSTLLGSSSAGRSRATSNTSNPAQDIAFQSLASPPTARPTDSSSAQVTETVGRMLQCVSVLASVQSKDEAQGKIEDLAKELKLNWLGRGRTGRNRRGFVGTRIRAAPTLNSSSSAAAAAAAREAATGSPTPNQHQLSRSANILTLGFDEDRSSVIGAGLLGMPGAFGGGIGRSVL